MYDSVLEVTTNAEGYELKEHGKFFYPVGCYRNDMSESKIILHWHEELEVIFVVEGSVIVGAGTAEKILHEGDGFFINSNILHDVRQVENHGGVIKSLVFHPYLIGNLRSIFWSKYLRPLIKNKNLPFIYFNGNSEKDFQIVSWIRQAWESEAEEKFGFEFEVRNFLSKIILKISEGKIEKIYAPTPQEQRDAERLKQMIKFIEQNFTKDLTVAEIAEQVSVSKSECLNCFKRTTGISPIQFLKEYRLLLASEKIRSTQKNISEIAEDCGFLDMSYFAKSFRQMFKISPTAYRKNFGQ